MKRTMRRIGVVAGAILVAILFAAIFIFLRKGQSLVTGLQSQDTNAIILEKFTDEEVKKKFDCHRVTTEVRDTDIYCQYPILYRTGDIPDEEMKAKLGCQSSARSLCTDPQALADYKARVLAQDKRLKTLNQ